MKVEARVLVSSGYNRVLCISSWSYLQNTEVSGVRFLPSNLPSGRYRTHQQRPADLSNQKYAVMAGRLVQCPAFTFQNKTNQLFFTSSICNQTGRRIQHTPAGLSRSLVVPFFSLRHLVARASGLTALVFTVTRVLYLKKLSECTTA